MSTRRPRSAGPTLTDVARAAGVSLATASRVFSGVATVDEVLVERVIEAGRRLDYHPDVAAQMTANGRSPLIGVIADEPRTARFGLILRGVVDAAGEHGLTVMVSSAGKGPQSYAGAAQTLAGYRPRGVVVVARGDVLADVAMPFRTGPTAGSVVGLGRSSVDPGVPVVDLGDLPGAVELAQEMGRHGYSRPLVLGTDEQFPVEFARTELLVQEVGRWSGSVTTERAAQPGRDAGFAAMTARLAEAGPAPDIVLTVADELAVGVAAAVRQHGLRPGQDVAVTGFDDLPLANDVVPTLTTVHTGLQEAGVRAVAAVLDPHGAVAPAPVPRLILRESTRAS